MHDNNVYQATFSGCVDLNVLNGCVLHFSLCRGQQNQDSAARGCRCTPEAHQGSRPQGTEKRCWCTAQPHSHRWAWRYSTQLRGSRGLMSVIFRNNRIPGSKLIKLLVIHQWWFLESKITVFVRPISLSNYPVILGHVLSYHTVYPFGKATIPGWYTSSRHNHTSEHPSQDGQSTPDTSIYLALSGTFPKSEYPG